MKKIFYKIFFSFIIISYLPLIVIYFFNLWYVDRYIIEKAKPELLKISGDILANELPSVMASFYQDISVFIVPIIFVLAYIFSRYFSRPIEELEKISSKISNLDFSSKINFRYNNELEVLGNNLNIMSEKLKKSIDKLNTLNSQLKIELEEKEKLMDFEKEFMRSIGHELKTPIAIINGYIEALQDGIVTEEERDNTYSIIYNEGIFLNKLIKNLNTYLKYEFKFSKDNYEEFKLKEMLETELNKYALDFKKKDIKLGVDISDDIIHIDRYRVAIILNNLFTNALTYVDDRRIINIEFKDMEFRISNSSEYIPVEKFSKIFSPFYKIDSSRNRKYGGTGLGLSIVKNMLTSMNLKHSLIFDEQNNFVIFNVKFV